MLKKVLRKVLPKKVWNLRHLYYAWRGAKLYGHPSEELFVIGVTGTSGKSSTISFLRQVLETAGFTVGSLSTVDFYIAGEDKLNDQKMTMLGKMQIQRYLREMVEKGCQIALVETTSEGRLQHRHRYINYDMMMLTNLYPEHIDSHGSFENYKQAKVDIFSYVASLPRKKALPCITAQHKQAAPLLAQEVLPKVAVINGDINEANDFLLDTFDKQHTFGMEDRRKGVMLLSNKRVTREGLQFSVQHKPFEAPIYGEYNAMNLLSVITLCRALGIDWKTIQKGIKTVTGVPGRIEFIPEAEQKGFMAIVDYAFEPVAMKALYKVVSLLQPQRVIHVFGSTGGGRDISRRFSVGEYVGKHADICIVTDEDPYDDDPQDIMNDVMSAVRKAGKEEGKNAFSILDRGEAIKKAVSLAQEGDLVLVTGKGSEQAMVVKGELVPWDDREEVRKSLRDKNGK